MRTEGNQSSRGSVPPEGFTQAPNRFEGWRKWVSHMAVSLLCVLRCARDSPTDPWRSGVHGDRFLHCGSLLRLSAADGVRFGFLFSILFFN